MSWSPQQEAIFAFFTNPVGNLVVRARAGTGKTTTIIEAVRHIHLDTEGNSPRILVCAFNKRIQEELQRKLAGSGAEAVTLHSLGYKFLRGAWGDLRVDNDVEDERIEKAVQATGDDSPPWEVRTAIKKLIGIAKGAAPFGSVDDLAELAAAHDCVVDDDGYPLDWIAAVARTAMDLARTPDSLGRITFDDMLFVPVANVYAIPLYDWVIVDEAQDMNESQLLIARGACKKDGHIVVVGDDRQAIYGFRGADSHALDRLKRELCAEELGLNTTYRCPRTVVEHAQRLVPDFFAAPFAPAGTVDTVSLDDLRTLVDPGDAILSRTNAPLVSLCLGLIRKGTPAKIEGRDVGKALAARAKKLKATTVEDFLRRLSLWGTRARTRAVARGRSVDQKLQEISDIEMTLEALTEDAKSVDDIYRRCEAMFGDVAGNGNGGLVVLSTVHKAKGLEWNRVFLLEGTLYCYGNRQDREEANIEYVAVTRAKQTLVLVKG